MVDEPDARAPTKQTRAHIFGATAHLFLNLSNETIQVDTFNSLSGNLC
jgi:hypothetical protein